MITKLPWLHHHQINPWKKQIKILILSSALAAIPPIPSFVTTTTTAYLSPDTSVKPVSVTGLEEAPLGTSPSAAAAGKTSAPSAPAATPLPPPPQLVFNAL